MQEVAQALWSLAKLRQTRPKLVARLAAQAGQIVDKLNGRDISTIVWAFGSMRSKMDPALLQSLSSAAVNLWDSMEPQVCSPTDLFCHHTAALPMHHRSAVSAPCSVLVTFWPAAIA